MLENVSQRAWGMFICGSTQNLTAHSPEQLLNWTYCAQEMELDDLWRSPLDCMILQTVCIPVTSLYDTTEMA